MNKQKGELSLPVSIIISGLIVAGAIMFTNSNKAIVEGTRLDPADAVAPSGDQGSGIALEKLREVTKDDHIKGSIKAPIKIVEFSDPECPFCARVHTTIQTILDEYGEDNVAWVYRQFPLTNLEQGFHVNAERAAAASECVADIAGNEAFWSFTDNMFATNAARSDELYISLATPLGVTEAELIECIDSGKHDQRIQNDIANAAETGGRGTPWVIIVGPDGEKFPINGAQPVEVFRSVIDQII